MSKVITCKNYRRFGVEIELNTTTDIIKDKHSVPDGADIVASLIQSVCDDPVTLNGWLHVNNNNGWIIKPDSTCGIEINSPVMKGGFDLLKLCKIVEALSQHKGIKADNRCSFHVHVNMEDLSYREIGTILAWWIKCEGVFFDSIKSSRKCHRHTQLIGMSDCFNHNIRYNSTDIIDLLSDVKYHSANAYHMRQNRRKSVEFRIAGNEFCLNPIFVKNWVRLLLHFVDMSLNKGFPKPYKSNDPWTGLLWLNPKEVFQFLNFDQNDISQGLKQVKSWFLDQLRRNVNQPNIGIWQAGFRSYASKEIRELLKYENDLSDEENHTLLYSKDYLL